MATKVFIDGSEGTTGLRIFERFSGRDDIEILKIDPELRKDPDERRKLINSSDITFLCLPDVAAKEAVSLIDPDNDHVVIIDASTVQKKAGPMVSRNFLLLISKRSRRATASRCRAVMPPALSLWSIR